jgi:crotonobetainyl-CoA:carnitine CoA-transferase CaiB-like acyl-CoA transferase
MPTEATAPGALSPYRVLDLTEGTLSLCGRLLADLGADVIKIEKPGGDDARSTGPFYTDVLDRSRSLFWWAYNVNKRGITLNLAVAEGREIFLRLAQSADFVIESFSPGLLERQGLGYDALAAVNPAVIVASITPYGQTGPKANYPWSDLTAWASCGAAYINGDPDRPPLCLGFMPQISAQAASELLTAMLIAHYEREVSHQGQHIDLSIQESAIGILQATIEMWDLAKLDYERAGVGWPTSSGATRRLIFACRDGYATLLQGGGGSVRMVAASQSLVDWMSESDMAPEWLRHFDWENEYDSDNLSQATVDRIEPLIERFLLTKTKREIYEEGWRRGIMIAPVNTMQDIATDDQLIERGFWHEVAHDELDASIVYCGPFAKLSETPLTTRRRPPLAGEHNSEIYTGELDLSPASLTALRSAGVI